MQIYERFLRFQILSQKDFGNGSDTHNEWHFQNGGEGDTSTNYALWKPSAFLKVLRKVTFSLLSRQSLELLFDLNRLLIYIYSANLNAKRVNYKLSSQEAKNNHILLENVATVYHSSHLHPLLSRMIKRRYVCWIKNIKALSGWLKANRLRVSDRKSIPKIFRINTF